MTMTSVTAGRLASLLVFQLATVRCYGGYSYDQCDYGSIQDDVSLLSLTPNQFHKICPRQAEYNVDDGFSQFGSPGCGDGTPFSFFASRPAQKYTNSDRVLIEFMGGGACWDADTCDLQSQQLTFPESLNDFMGLSCSEIAAGLEMKEDDGDSVSVSMLCARSVGDVNFASYNTIVVPCECPVGSHLHLHLFNGATPKV